MKFRTIIIEDDPMVASINQSYLMQNKQMEFAGIFRNGKEAFEFCKKGSIDLAIVDYYMPIMDGKEFIRRCLEEHLKMDFIMITAANQADDIRDMIQMGAVDYLIKPFTRERFQSALQRFLERHAALQPGSQLNQEDIDRLFSFQETVPGKKLTEPLEKGLQQQTLELVRNYIGSHNHEYLSSVEIAKEIGLSRSTVRRYLSYLLDEKEIESQVDYGTGGRPSIKYRLRIRRS